MVVARGPRVAWLLPLLAIPWSGCAAVDPTRQSTPSTFQGDDETFRLHGLVVDAEIVPIEQAFVELKPIGLAANTTSGGRFAFDRVAPGDYVLHVSKAGYASVKHEFVIAQSAPDQILITLTPVAGHLPFHETNVFVAYIFCTATVGGTFAPCVPINVLTGQNVTQDRAEFNFRIPHPGLMELLHEMLWKTQSTGHDMSVTIRPPGQPLVVGGVTVIYLSAGGGSPLRSWVTVGKVNAGATQPFDGNETTPYATILRGRSTNTTGNAASVYLDHRVNNYFTFFYNRPGPREFTVIPDA